MFPHFWKILVAGRSAYNVPDYWKTSRLSPASPASGPRRLENVTSVPVAPSSFPLQLPSFLTAVSEEHFGEGIAGDSLLFQ